MLTKLSVSNFRCLESASLSLDPACSLIIGDNGSGKTSLLEAMYCLSRGRSFRTARRDHAIRYGADAFTLFGEIARSDHIDRVGLEISRQGRRIRVNGKDVERVGDLAKLLAVYIIDPTLHELIDGGPESRRRYLDFGVFHVEQGFLSQWSSYRRALAQRNEALRTGASDAELDSWDHALVAPAEALAEWRHAHVAAVAESMADIAEQLLPDGLLTIAHRRGWPDGADLRETLFAHRDRDRQSGITQDGAHRADVRVVFRERMARHQVSRGQQKLAAAVLILAQIRVLHAAQGSVPLLLVDDPAAELDSSSLERLLLAIFAVPCQRVLTGLDRDRLKLPMQPRVFHVEHGQLKAWEDR